MRYRDKNYDIYSTNLLMADKIMNSEAINLNAAINSPINFTLTMAFPRVETFLCCMSLKTGGKFLSILNKF